MFIGEAPGANENTQQIPFVGKAGEIWEQLLDSIDLKRQDVYITNVVKYQPMRPTNRDPSPYEVSNSLPYLTEEVNLVNPKVIVPMGRFATRAFYPDKDASHTRGKVLERRGRYVAPIYHPAAAGYNEVLLPKLEKQFRTIRRLLG
jgi:DNA polymerase